MVQTAWVQSQLPLLVQTLYDPVPSAVQRGTILPHGLATRIQWKPCVENREDAAAAQYLSHPSLTAPMASEPLTTLSPHCFNCSLESLCPPVWALTLGPYHRPELLLNWTGAVAHVPCLNVGCHQCQPWVFPDGS